MNQKAKLLLNEDKSPYPECGIRQIPMSDNSDIQKVICPYCNLLSVLLWVHGHYQCINCKAVVISCCNGESDIQL